MTVQAPPEKWTRLEKIAYLLDQWEAIFDPSASSLGPNSDPLGVTLLPRMANHPSVRELDRTLRLLKTAAPCQHDHVKAYHCAEWRIRTDKIKRRVPNGKRFETADIRRRERLTPSWVKLGNVHAGEQFLAAQFQGEVFIPDELWDALHTPAMAA